MGVKGVAELFYSKRVENERGWTKETIRTEKLVVDANQFCHQVSGFKKSRNNYAGFSECVAKIIHKLRGWRVEPYFVYDGVDKEQKFRRSSDSKPLMPLVYTVLRHVLGEEKVDVCVGDGEGDETCVKVANSFNCPVLSQDSDYLFFDISGGYIDWKFCPIESLFDSDSEVFEIEVYRRTEFVQTHYFGVDDHLFMFPVIINKGIHPEAGKQFENEPYAGFVDDFIKQSRPSISSSKFEKEFLKVKVYYNETGQENPEKILAQKIPKCEKDLPVWLHNSYRRFEIPYVMLFDVLVNGKQHHSRSDLSKHIRQSWYAIIGVREVKEYIYDVGKIIRVPCGPPPPITLEKLDDKDSFVKKRVFYNALCCNEREAELLSHLEGESLGERFVIATIIYWMKESRPPIILCKALLACFVRLSKMHREREDNILCRSDDSNRTPSNDKLHLERWQSVYKDASVVFLLLRYPLDSIPCPSRVFNETIILDLFNDAAIDGFIRDGDVQQKYLDLIGILGV